MEPVRLVFERKGFHGFHDKKEKHALATEGSFTVVSVRVTTVVIQKGDRQEQVSPDRGVRALSIMGTTRKEVIQEEKQSSIHAWSLWDTQSRKQHTSRLRVCHIPDRQQLHRRKELAIWSRMIWFFKDNNTWNEIKWWPAVAWWGIWKSGAKLNGPRQRCWTGSCRNNRTGARKLSK